MEYQTVAVFVLAAWLLIGVALGVVMERRGYSGFGWGIVGAVFGPIAVVAAAFMRDRGTRHDREHIGRRGVGPVDVLVGIDGSREAIAAAISTVGLIGPALGRLTLAAVAPFDATDQEEADKRAALDAAAAELADATANVDPDVVLLHGQPAQVLRNRVVDQAYDLIALGAHGRGMSKAVLGSVAADLVRTSPVPVMVSGHARVTPDALGRVDGALAS